MQKITPCLWFDKEAEQAANFYVSIFKKSKIEDVAYYGKAGAEVSGQKKDTVMTVAFSIGGQKFLGLNGGPVFKFTPAISFIVNCKTQAEIDYYWEKLLRGGKKSQCGWLEDKFGVSWQIVPEALDDMMSHRDPVRSERVMKAMLKMKKLDIRTLKKAYNEPVDRNKL